MSDSPLPAVHRLATEALDALDATAGPGAADDALVALLTLCEGLARRLDRLVVATVATLLRRGVFAERGYTSTAAALGDLLGWERSEARRRVLAAEQVCPRIGLDGAALPARLPATAAVFAEGRATLRHVETIAKILATPAAGRLSPPVWAGAEAELADKATIHTPSELHAYGTRLIEMLDADGPEPDDEPPAPVNELTLTRHRGAPGGTLKGRFDDAALFDAIATVLDAKAAPLTGDDDRPTAQRQAEALAEVCGYVLDHAGCVPEGGGHRPHLNVLVRLEDLETRARSAVLDFGGTLTPPELRMLACDAAVIPIVMNGAGQPLDVGRLTRTIPDGLRRAIAARDLGCAFPGCGRTPSWCQVHHIRPWERGGETTRDNLVMLCRVHHRMMHSSGWVVRLCEGLPEFIPPRWIDPDQTPRRRPFPHLII
ncbi:HNH endonuclease signature motif containing protein [Pseudonocardia asaccharolytica]|uniref:HNH endonuclease signature motif containing protein n=1 Tax=Pseudonocardia asaccharolytica TaxID=54010 RepID=UPI00040F82D9|nr:HNH endonuclease signature motif containing protein [Pseudonocardia asaccharolytica]